MIFDGLIRPSAFCSCDVSRISNEIIKTLGNADAPVTRNGTTRDLRWAILVVIEETARHAGHADIIREQIDGRTGR